MSELIDKQALIDKLMEMAGVGSNSDALETIKRFPAHEPNKLIVPECFDIDFKAYKAIENSTKSGILMTAIGGIHRVAFPSTFKHVSARVAITGIEWNEWSSETILWASKNYADFCQAVISEDYEVEKAPLYYVPLPDADSEAVIYALKKRRSGSIEISLVNRRKLGVYDSTKLSEQEIKSVDERYLPFAVPIKEVTEE